MEDMTNAVETLVENNEVMTDVVKNGLKLNKTGVYVVAGVVVVGATYVIGKKVYNKMKANKEDTGETEQPESKIKMALFKKKPVENETCENEKPKFEPDENR